MRRKIKQYRYSEQEINEGTARISKKWREKTPLTDEEKVLACACLKFNHLLLHPFCVDEFFSRTFLGFYDRLTGMQQIAYWGLVNEWGDNMNKTNHSDPLLQRIAKETREELKVLREQFIVASYNYTSLEYDRNKLQLLEWSKYRYLVIKKIFDQEIKGPEYKLFLNGKEIVFNEESAAHIFTRHFGDIMKSYISDKSHFIKDFCHEGIHLDLETVFNRIDKSNLYIRDSVEQITFRFNGTIYRIYCNPKQKNVKGVKGIVNFMQLATFFPLEEQDKLNDLQSNFVEKEIDQDLSIFVSLQTV